MKYIKNFKKSQQIHINHFGAMNNDCMTLFTTVGQYPKILDEFSCEAVKTALEYLQRTFAIETFAEHKGIGVQVILIEN